MACGEWRLMRGGLMLAVLNQDGLALVPELDGQFTLEAAYETSPAFEPVRHLFAREVLLLDADDEPEIDEWAAIWDELQAPGLFVESADGRERFAILWIHFEHGRAWWWPLSNSPLTRIRREKRCQF